VKTINNAETSMSLEATRLVKGFGFSYGQQSEMKFSERLYSMHKALLCSEASHALLYFENHQQCRDQHEP
jgi:hypothetical protein